MRTKILDAATDLLAQEGLGGWSIDAVAKRAGCAKGLVIYHYSTKAQLLAAVAERLASSAAANRRTAAGAAGSAALDRLWDAMVAEVRSGRFAARVALIADRVAAPARDSGLVATLAGSLGIDETHLGNEEAIEGILDGLSLQLLRGAPPADVREAYDRLWLGQIAP